MLPVNKLICPSHINTMVSLALEAHDQRNPEFLRVAIEHLAQYPLTPEQNDKIVEILKNVATISDQKGEGTASALIRCILSPPLLDMPPDVMRSIFSHLSFQDVFTCSRVCKGLDQATQQASQDEIFCQEMYRRNLKPYDAEEKLSSGFLQVCKNAYVANQFNFPNGVYSLKTLPFLRPQSRFIISD